MNGLTIQPARFVDMAVYDEGAKAGRTLAALKGKPCWLAVDLSSTSGPDGPLLLHGRDDGEDGYFVHPWFFLPRRQPTRPRRFVDGVPYPLWAETGTHYTHTPGQRGGLPVRRGPHPRAMR